MPTKAEMYAQMAEQVAAKLTNSWQEWTGFLTTAARLYKYTFQDQMMIYAQRPDATACAEYDLWNDKMGRYVRRGSKGIALVDDTGDRPRLRYVFDISDTGTREHSRTPWLWQLEEQHKGPVSAMLEHSYGASGDDLPQQIIDVAGKLAGAYWEDHRRDFFHIVDDSFLEEYDDYNIEMQFKAAATVSISYALMSRCGLEPERFFDREDFITISDFNSPATIGALGEVVSQSSEQVLRQIGVTIRNYEREHTTERSMNHGEQSDLHPERRLPDPEPDLERTAIGTPGQVRTDAADVSQNPPASDLQSDAAVRESVSSPAGSGRDGEQPSGTDDAPAGEGSGSDGGAESPRSDAVGGPDEHLQGTGRGNPDGGTHQQLSFFPSEAEQIEQIDRRAETEKVSAFSFSGEDIALAMASGSGFAQGKERIAAYFAENHTPKERAEFLKKEYGIGGQSWTFLDGSHGFLEYNARGIQLRSYPEGQEQRFSWSDAAKRIGVLIAAGKYLDEAEQDTPEVPSETADDPRTEGETLREKLADRGIENGRVVDPEKLDNDPFIQQVVSDAEQAAAEPAADVPEESAPVKPEKPLTAEDVTDIQVESSSYSAISREKEYYLSCKINGVPDTLVYTVSQHDDGEGFTIQSGQREEDDIWHKMSQSELEKLEGILAQTVEFDYWSKSIEHAADADALEVVALDYRWAENLNLSDEQQDALWSQIETRRAQLTAQPTFATEPVAAYPAEETNLPYDVVVEKLHIEPPIEPPEQEAPAPPAQNFHISDSHLGEGGPKQKFARNVEAIRTLQTLENENRNATPEEQEILSRYVGWGGLADAFDPDKENWSKQHAQLKELLTPEEYGAARASTLNAHYTSPTVIRSIYDAVERMGFRSGNILEPACGVGNFFGMLPESMQGSRLYGVELDSISGRIAQKLYPEANITVAGFETTKQQDFYDLAIGNVPFGNYKVNDKAYNNLGFSIHNYFFAKALDQVRPGGVVAFVTSRYTLDSKDSSARKYMAERADLLGAIRLPNNAFRANAGTDVVSDIVFLQKRDRPIDREPDWVQLGQTESGISINQYFVDHPEMVLGELTTESTQYGREESTVLPLEGADLGEQLKEAVNQIHGTYQEAELPDLGEGEAIETSIPADPNVKNYSYAVVDGTVYFRENSRMVRPELNATAEARVKGMVGLRGCVQELIELQMDAAVPDSDIQEKQAELNRLYDDFSAKYGLINDRANRLAFADDSSYYLLCALEVIDENGKLKSKADMFSKRTIKPHKAVTSVDTASEALAVSISEKACVDMEYMEQLTGKPREELAEELKGVIFRLPEPVPEGEKPSYVTADEYLSGNVRKKLRQAQLAAQQDPSFAINVEALTAAQPKDLDASEIEVRLGATWIDKKYIQQFMYETFDTPFYMRHGSIQVNYSSYTAEWQITGKTYLSKNDVAAYTTYGTDRANAYRLLEDALNLRDIRIYDTIEDVDGREKRVLNAKETTLAAQKQQAIRDAFKDWIWQDPERRQTLVRQYNEEMNATRPREYDGSHITFGGMNPAITLREHQLGAIAHVLYGGNTLLAHEVGAGKTFEMVAAAMESKRLGLCQKSLFVVPNHLTEQWASEFLRLYPSAKILVTTKKDFESHNRKKFCSRIATGDYDAVIIGHSQFERIPISQERQERLLQEQIDEITEGIAEVKSNGGERFTIKQLERTRKSLEARLEKLQAEGRKDDVVTFEQLGVDRLFVDEAHNYKNLFLYTKMRNVAGLSTSDAQKSSDMFAKCRYMDEITGSRGVVFATGTPVSNSMTELYTMQRYLQYDRLQELNMTHFDCWASRFGETVTALELAPEGTGYRARTRFSKFFNLPELMNLFREVADIKTADQLHLPTPEVEYHNVVAQPTEQQQEMVKALSERASLVHSGTVDPSQDNMLKIVRC